MFKLSPIARIASKLLTKQKFGFCINHGYLNPAKHITMNHNPHNIYIDAWDIGQYPEVI
jgi:hypothetical protein